MDATALTIVSQLITDARSRFGAANVVALEVDGALLDDAMDHVLAIGGEVSLDQCVVDGVIVRERPPDAQTPMVELRDGRGVQALTPLEG